MAAGTLASGFVLSKFKPRARYVTGWNVFIGVVYILGEASYIFLGCSSDRVYGDFSAGRYIHSCSDILLEIHFRLPPFFDRTSIAIVTENRTNSMHTLKLNC